MQIPAEQISTFERVLRLPEVRQRIGLSRATIWRMVRAGQFPQPIRLSSPASVGWLKSEVEAWLHERAAARQSTEA